ncbi:unnamed protein product [Paramecium octaurelia]|uniref:Uncharacterized protein n=1 Tax=Paramecium octaurelia TaxID=43137 RepID=A0A8S1V4P2_PAROT|nr:unnamed protein product [Paramecium octaurelia]
MKLVKIQVIRCPKLIQNQIINQNRKQITNIFQAIRIDSSQKVLQKKLSNHLEEENESNQKFLMRRKVACLTVSAVSPQIIKRVTEPIYIRNTVKQRPSLINLVRGVVAQIVEHLTVIPPEKKTDIKNNQLLYQQHLIGDYYQRTTHQQQCKLNLTKKEKKSPFNLNPQAIDKNLNIFSSNIVSFNNKLQFVKQNTPKSFIFKKQDKQCNQVFYIISSKNTQKGTLHVHSQTVHQQRYFSCIDFLNIEFILLQCINHLIEMFCAQFILEKTLGAKSEQGEDLKLLHQLQVRKAQSLFLIVDDVNSTNLQFFGINRHNRQITMDLYENYQKQNKNIPNGSASHK